MTRMQQRRSNQDGFTLIEIMVVILILGLLATIVVQSLRGATDKAKRIKAQADISALKTALDRYYLDNGSYPSSDQGLALAGGRDPDDVDRLVRHRISSSSRRYCWCARASAACRSASDSLARASRASRSS